MAAPKPTARDLSALAKYGFVGASQRANARDLALRAALLNRGPRLEAVSPEQARALRAPDLTRNDALQLAVNRAIKKQGLAPPPLNRVLGFAQNLGKDVAGAVTGVPGVVGTLVSGAAVPTPQHPFSPGQTRVAKGIARSYAHQYGPLVHGNTGEFLHRLYEHPLGPIQDVATVLSLGAAAGSKAGLLKAPPPERSLSLGKGKVQPFASPNTLTRLGQQAADRFAERHPLAPVVGAEARIARRLPFELAREHERALAPSAGFAAVARRLKPAERLAYTVLADYGDKAPHFINREILFRKKRLREAPRESVGQVAQLAILRVARKHVLAPSATLARAAEAGRKLSQLSKTQKIGLGQLTEQAAEERLNLHARLVEGARYEKPTPGKLGQSPALDAAERRVARLQKAFDRTPRRGYETLERPRTETEARARLAELEARHEKFYEQVTRMAFNEKLTPADLAEQRRRNALNAQIAKARSGKDRLGRPKGGISPVRGAEYQPTVKAEQRQIAETEFEKTLERLGEHPAAVRFRAERTEIAALRDALNPLPGEKIGRGALGNVSEFRFRATSPTLERVGGALSVAKDEAQRLAARAASRQKPTGFVGAEGVRAGEGAFYVPDVARPAIRSLFQRAPSVTGKPRKIVQRSEGILFTQGRQRRFGPRLTLEDFARSTRAATQLADIERARAFSKPLSPASPNGLEPGHRFFNPEGVKLPRRLNEQSALAEIESLTPKEFGQSLRADSEQTLRNVFPQEGDLANLPPKVRENVRQLPEGIVRAFEGRRLRIPGQDSLLARSLLGAFDTTNNVSRFALLYLKGGFVPANFLGDTAFLALQQGFWTPVNLLKAARVLGDLSPETLRRLDLEVGTGPALAIAGEGQGLLGRTTQKVGHVSNTAASLLTRRAAIIHELAKRGYESDAEIRALLDDASKRPVLNQISEQAENAIVNYRSISPSNRAIISRAIFIAPWVFGSTKYVARLQLDRPLRAELVAKLGQQGSDEVFRRLGRIVSYLNGIVPLGPLRHERGTTVQNVRNPASVTPFGTFADVVNAGRGLVSHDASTKRLISFASPALKAGFEAATGYNTFTGRPYPASATPGEILYASTVKQYPVTKLITGLVSPKFQPGPVQGSPSKQPVYLPPATASEARKQALERFLLPSVLVSRKLNLPAAQARGISELPPGKRELAQARAAAKQLLVEGRATGYLAPNEPLPKEVQQALTLRARRRAGYATSEHGQRLQGRDLQISRLRVDVELLRSVGLYGDAEVKEDLKAAELMTAEEIQNYRARLSRDWFGQGGLSQYERDVRGEAATTGGTP